MCSNYYPHYILIPGSLIEGVATGLMWTAHGTSLTNAAARYSALTGEDGEIVLSRFFGIFCTAFQSTQIWGNLVSSLVLQNGNGTHRSHGNGTIKEQCGAENCPTVFESNTYANYTTIGRLGPDKTRLDILVSIYLVCALTGLFITIMCLRPDELYETGSDKLIVAPGSAEYSASAEISHNLRSDTLERKEKGGSRKCMSCVETTKRKLHKTVTDTSKWGLMTSTLCMLFTDLNIVLLIPLCVYTGPQVLVTIY